MYIQLVEYAMQGHIYWQSIPSYDDFIKSDYTYYIELAYKRPDGSLYYDKHRIELQSIPYCYFENAVAHRVYYSPVIGITVYLDDVNGRWRLRSKNVSEAELPLKKSVDKVQPNVLINYVSGFYGRESL